MTKENSDYSDHNYEDKADYEVVKSYESVNRLSPQNSNLFSLFLVILIALMGLIIIFQFQTIGKLEKKVQKLEEKVQRLEEKVNNNFP